MWDRRKLFARTYRRGPQHHKRLLQLGRWSYPFFLLNRGGQGWTKVNICWFGFLLFHSWAYNGEAERILNWIVFFLYGFSFKLLVLYYRWLYDQWILQRLDFVYCAIVRLNVSGDWFVSLFCHMFSSWPLYFFEIFKKNYWKWKKKLRCPANPVLSGVILRFAVTCLVPSHHWPFLCHQRGCCLFLVLEASLLLTCHHAYIV